MGAKSRLKNEMRQASARAGGSHMTKQARNYFINLFIATLFALGFPLQRISQITVRAVVAFMGSRARRSIRTRQNDMAHLRTILRNAGRRQFAGDPKIANAALGISGGSRRGSKEPISDSDFAALLVRVKDAGLRAILMLERALGLRAKEAVMSLRSLQTWRAAIVAGKREVRVIFGTKGGRPRWAGIVDRDSALTAIDAAISVTASQGKLAPKRNLKAALRWYANATNRLGIQGHALRYAYTNVAVQKLLNDGYLLAEALAIAATWLGHGDGRGRMVKSVYGRGHHSTNQTVS